MSLELRISNLENIVSRKQSAQTRRILEDLTDKACEQLPANMGLTEFTDWLRGLYPELYKSNKPAQRHPADELPRCPTCGKPEDVEIDEKGKVHIRR